MIVLKYDRVYYYMIDYLEPDKPRGVKGMVMEGIQASGNRGVKSCRKGGRLRDGRCSGTSITGGLGSGIAGSRRYRKPAALYHSRTHSLNEACSGRRLTRRRSRHHPNEFLILRKRSTTSSMVGRLSASRCVMSSTSDFMKRNLVDF